MYPLISVVMPMRNAQRFVLESIQSVLEQTLREFEVIIVDDSSEDDSVALVESVADHRFRILRHTTQRGVAASLNRGLAEARAPLVARMDADDVCHPDRFRQQLAFLRVNPDIAVVGSCCYEIDELGRQIGVMERPLDSRILAWNLYFACLIVHPSVMMRADIVRSVGGYATDVPHAEDYDLWLRLAARASLANLPTPLLSYRRHAQQVGRRFRSIQRESSYRIRARAIGELLFRQVSDAVVRWWCVAMWREVLETEQALLQVADLLMELMDAYFDRWQPQGEEARIIRNHAASWLRTLAGLHMARFPHASLRLVACAESLRIAPN